MENLDQRAYFEHLASRGQLSAAGLDTALRRLGHIPDAAAWRRFADQGLLALGTLMILAGVVFFFAFNWQELHRFAKLGLVATPLAGCAVAAAWLGLERGAGQACLAGAVVLTGVLLAVAGQIYQTGADSELLFFAWALLILPWAVLARAPWLWLFWVLLGNVSLILYIAGRLDVWALFALGDGLYWTPLLFNTAAVLLWEGGWPRYPWLRAGYGPRLLVVAAGIFATILGVSWWWLDNKAGWRWMQYSPLLYVACWLGAVGYYSRRRRDIVPLAVAALSGICVIVAAVVKHLKFREAFAGEFLLLALLVAGLSAAAALWLRRISTGWEQAG